MFFLFFLFPPICGGHRVSTETPSIPPHELPWLKAAGGGDADCAGWELGVYLKVKIDGTDTKRKVKKGSL